MLRTQNSLCPGVLLKFFIRGLFLSGSPVHVNYSLSLSEQEIHSSQKVDSFQKVLDTVRVWANPFIGLLFELALDGHDYTQKCKLALPISS